MEQTAVVGKTSSTEQILGHHLTSRRLSSNIAGAFEDVSVCTLLFGERERKLDYVTSPVLLEPLWGTGVCLISWLTSNPVFIWVSNLIFCIQDSFMSLSIYSHKRKVLVIFPLKTSRNKFSSLSLKSQTNTNKKAINQIRSKQASTEPATVKINNNQLKSRILTTVWKGFLSPNDYLCPDF